MSTNYAEARANASAMERCAGALRIIFPAASGSMWAWAVTAQSRKASFATHRTFDWMKDAGMQRRRSPHLHHESEGSGVACGS